MCLKYEINWEGIPWLPKKMTQYDKQLYRNRVSAQVRRIRQKVQTDINKEDNDEVTNAIDDFIQVI